MDVALPTLRQIFLHQSMFQILGGSAFYNGIQKTL